MNRSVIITICLLYSLLGKSQTGNFTYPDIVPKGTSIHRFIPNGWELVDSLSHDFNGDKRKDYAMVIKTQSLIKSSDSDCIGEEYHPKMLLVLFNDGDMGYIISVVAHKLFGTCNWGVQGMDPYDNIVVRKNTLGISFLTGGTERNSITYYARLHKNEWVVVGVNSYQYWAGHLETGSFTVDINLMTGERESYETTENGKTQDYKKTTFPKAIIKLADLTDNSFAIAN